ncbi:helix-turn-helix transcriptional regulator [Embleya hyalina]|uniref:helix-turn-helix transcriptional regulator n=1 Tax=Embleya hyalina TaxID=516124 RepID=UPI000F83247A|nr:helix-turn-helix transcriptional regulator [Embleya hyalina]
MGDTEVVEGPGRVAAMCRETLGDEPGIRRPLAEGSSLDIVEITCCDDQRSFRPPIFVSEPEAGVTRMLLVRSGGFLARVNGREEFTDPVAGFVLRQGDEVAVAHPAHTRDISTMLDLGRDVYGDLLLPPARDPVVPVTAALDLAHRRLVSACRAGIDRFEVAERVHHLLTTAAAPRTPARTGRRAATVRAHRRLVAHTRAVLIDGPLTASLEELGRHVGCSPFHLSRVFHQVTGQTLNHYRNQLRVRAVAEDLADGHSSLRTLATTYGFADQAHLTRVFRQHTGLVPSAVRAMLRPAGPGR